MTEELHHLAGVYVLDALDGDEKEKFEAHLEVCEVCQSDVAEFAAVGAELAEMSSTAPPIGLKERVMAEVSVTRQVPPEVPNTVVDLAEARQKKVPRSVILSAAAVAVLALVGLFAALQVLTGPSLSEEIMAAPDAVVTEITGDGGSMEVVWSESHQQMVLIGDDMPDPETGTEYQLWTVHEDGSVGPEGVFVPVDGSVESVLDLQGELGSGWAVTVEPSGGSQEPSSAPVMVGEFQ